MDFGLGSPEARLKRGPLMTSSYSANRDHTQPTNRLIKPRKGICWPWCYAILHAALGVVVGA